MAAPGSHPVPPRCIVPPHTSEHSCFGGSDAASCLGAAKPVPASHGAASHQSFPCPTLKNPGTIPVQHRVPDCFPQAPWSFTESCRLHVLLSPPHPSGKGRGPPAPPGAAWCSSCNWDRPSSQKSTALHLPPAPGLVPSSITALPWFLPIAPPGLGCPGPAPHKAGAAAALCHLLHHCFLHKEHNSRCLFTLRAFSRGQLL